MTSRKHLYGFTLVELLVVLVIVGLIAALVGPVVYQRIGPAKQTTAQTQVNNFMSALDSYFVDMGVFPSTQQGLAALRSAPETSQRWNGPYLKKEIPSDPWDRPYQYRSPGRNGGYEIFSYGADGKEGGVGEDQDVTSWDAR